MAQLVYPNIQETIDQPSDSDTEDSSDVSYVVSDFGAMEHGKLNNEWVDDKICISEYPLSSSTVC